MYVLRIRMDLEDNDADDGVDALVNHRTVAAATIEVFLRPASRRLVHGIIASLLLKFHGSVHDTSFVLKGGGIALFFF